MSRPCMLQGGGCDEEAQPRSPFCPAHGREHGLTNSFTYCQQHEVVHLSHFLCPACALEKLGFHMEVIHDNDPHKSCGRYINSKDSISL